MIISSVVKAVIDATSRTPRRPDCMHRRFATPDTGTMARIFLMLLALWVSGCAMNSLQAIDDPAIARITDPRARELLLEGNARAAADIYTARAARSDDIEERQDALLIAAEILLDRAMLEPGQEKFAALPPVMATLPLQHRRDILAAKRLLYGDKPAAALDALPDPLVVVSPLHRARVYETRAQSYRILDEPDNELTARIALEGLLEREVMIDRNHATIWQLLTTQPLPTLRGMTTNVQSDTYQGWIELALAHAEAGSDYRRRSEQLSRWQDRFSDHPAVARFLPDLLETTRLTGFSSDGRRIERLAVLLPLSDESTAPVAAAIRDGMVAAWQQARSRQQVPSLRFYDVGSNTAYARTVYDTAISDGADAVIGPLRKQAVAAIVTRQDLPVPTITLNTVETDTLQPESGNIIQFGLSPEDEAEAAASRAIALSLEKAIVLQSDDSRGDREARAFQDALYRYGGDVVHVSVLPQDQYDYSEQIRQALLITESDERFRRLSRTIGEKLFFEPSIRNDIDVVFLAITSEQARSVRPQLDFFHASHIPRFGTSRISAPEDDEKANRDLNTIFYANVPWVVRESLLDDALRQTVVAEFPAADGVFGPLYALGIDAFTLATNLDALAAGETLSGYTGELSLAMDGRIRRLLDWAQYRNGEATPVERIESDPLPAIRSGGGPSS